MADEATAVVDESTANNDDAGAGAKPVETPGADALGDAGKKALDAMKADRNTARAEAKAVADELAALRAQVEGKHAEYEAEQKQRAADKAALDKADTRILKAEVRAAAAGKLADPLDALRFLDLSAFEVGADGEVDGDAINDALNDLISTKPYLAAQGKRFQGDADGGARKEQTADIAAQIVAAQKAGNFQLAIALKEQAHALASAKS